MDTNKRDSINSWIVNAEEARETRPPPNVIRVGDLAAYFKAFSSPFNTTNTNSRPAANFRALRSTQTTSTPAPQVDLRACPPDLLIDTRTLSEVDREVAEARAYQPEEDPLTSISHTPQHNLKRTSNPTSPPSPRRQNRRRGRGRGGHQDHTMAEVHPAKPQYIPPHLRQRQYTQPQANQATTNNGNHTQPSDAFQVARDKWANQNQAEREGGVALNGGVVLNVGESLQSSTPNTTTYATTTPIVPASTATPLPAATQNGQNPSHSNGTDARGQTHPPTAPRAVMKDRKQHMNQGRPKRNDKWVTNKEIRERAMKNANEPAGAWGDSNASEAGFDSNPNGDAQHDIKKLVDWEGNWLPGPVDWETRRSYRHHNFNEEMVRFITDSVDKEAAVNIYNEPTFLDSTNGEVAPRIWASISVEDSSIQQWWNNHIDSSLADTDSKAWWRSYITLESSLLVPHETPEARIDPDDDEGKILYQNDLGSGHASDKLMERKNKKKAAKERRNAAEREQGAATAASIQANYQEPETLKPLISLYIRPALAADAPQIAGIYNHYVQNSVRSAEVAPISSQELTRRMADETSNAMPWLVACQKGKKNSRAYQNCTDSLIIGFACASDYHSRQSAYGFTAEAEVYVHHHYLRKKVGSCLLDRLLYVLDPFYSLQDGYQFIGSGPFAEHGGVRVIGSAVMQVNFNKRDPDDLKGVTEFLSKFNFKKEGELPNLGVKLERRVSLALFRYYTGSTIDPRSSFVA